MANDGVRKATDLGTLYAFPCGDSEYPGIMIGLERNGVRYEFAWVEVDQWDNDEDPVMKIHVFDTEGDEPVYDLNINADALNKMYKEGK